MKQKLRTFQSVVVNRIYSSQFVLQFKWFKTSACIIDLFIWTIFASFQKSTFGLLAQKTTPNPGKMNTYCVTLVIVMSSALLIIHKTDASKFGKLKGK